MDSKYTNNPYSPFPPGMQCDTTMYGSWRNLSCCETRLDDTRVRFILILATPFMNSNEEIGRRRRLTAAGFERSQVYPEIAWLGYMPEEGAVYWIYKVTVDTIENEYLKTSDSEIWQEHADNIETVYFDSFEQCMAHLRRNYRVEESDFRKIYGTNYPKC